MIPEISSLDGGSVLARSNAHDGAGFKFGELAWGRSGRWDIVSSALHIAFASTPFQLRQGSPRNPFRPVLPSSLICRPGGRFAAEWRGDLRSMNLEVAPGFVARAIGSSLADATIATRDFAHSRPVDTADSIVERLLGSIAVEVRNDNPAGPTFIETLVLALVHHAVKLPPMEKRLLSDGGGLSMRQLRLVLDLIDEDLQGKLSLTDLARSLDVSTSYLGRAFHRSIGVPPHQYIIQRRVDRARALIEDGEMSLSEVALAVGFADHSHMAATFRKVLKTSPSAFAKGEEVV
jgi:AraC-like DNA-binding protein